MSQTPTIGRIVLYTLDEQNAQQINKRRFDADSHTLEHRANSNGVQVHVGNDVRAGDVFPMIITRVWETSGSVNGQVFLDGNDLFWAGSVDEGAGERHYAWPTRT